MNQTSRRTSENSNSDPTAMLELPAQKSKATTADVRSTLMKIVDNSQEQIHNIHRHGNQGKIQMGSARNKKQNRNEKFVCRLVSENREERIGELEGMLIPPSYTEMHRQ